MGAGRRDGAAGEGGSTAVGSSGNGAVRRGTAAVRDDGPVRVVTEESGSRLSIFQGRAFGGGVVIMPTMYHCFVGSKRFKAVNSE